MRKMELALRLSPPLDWSRTDGSAAFASIMGRIQINQNFALDLVDYLLAGADEKDIKSLNKPLALAGSEWQAVASLADEIDYCLANRTAGPIESVVRRGTAAVGAR